MNHIIFFIAYIYFLYKDMTMKKIDIRAIGIYALVALISVFLTKDTMTMSRFVDMLFSIAFGLIIYMFSYFSGGGIGLADGMYFVINGLLLTLRENIILFLTGLLVAFLFAIFLYIFCKEKRKWDLKMPFMPCFLPVIIGYILCTA